MAYGSASVSSTAVAVEKESASSATTTTYNKNSSLGVQDAIELRRRLGKVKEYAKLALTIIAALPLVLKAIEKLFSIMEVAIKAIQGLIAMIQKLKDFVVFLYRNYIKKCNVANQSPISNDGSVNANLLDEEIQKAIDKAATGTLTATDTKGIHDKMTILYNDLLEDLKEQGNTRIVERLYQIEDDLQTSYEVITVPLP